MATSSSRLALGAALAIAAAAGPAIASPCDGEGGFAFTMFTTRFAMIPEPAPTEGLGLELSARGPSATWGACRGPRHQLDVSELEQPDRGDPDRTFVHLGIYRLQWQLDAVQVHVGFRAVTRWADNLRFFTPVAGVTVEHAALRVRAELASAGLFLAARGGTPTMPRDDLALQVDAAWPASAAVRGEVRARARRYRVDAMRRQDDLTVSAGVGLAFDTRTRQRALPAFLGLALRRGDDTRVFVVAELSLGLADR